jgi:hypothetical protein
MGERQKVEERIRRKQAEIQGLEDKVKAAKVYLTALRDVLKIMDDGDEDDASSAETKLKAGSSVALARDIILNAGEPMHADDLLREMDRAVTPGNRSSIVGSLSAYVRKEEIFTRPAPNTFGLIELGHTEEVVPEDEEPPAGFGRTEVEANPWADDDDIPF